MPRTLLQRALQVSRNRARQERTGVSPCGSSLPYVPLADLLIDALEAIEWDG